MHRNTRIPSQPESPTHEPSGSPTRPSVRRNLFSAHLSRRPASSQTGSQSPKHSNSQPQSQSQSQQHPHLSPPRPNYPQSRQPSQNDSPFASPPLVLHPSFSDTYDPTISPNHALSPHSSATFFPFNSIVAVHPVTGRPLLPNLPVLPARLRLSEDDDDDEDEEEHSGDDERGHENNDDDHDDDESEQAQHHAHDPFAHPTQKPTRKGYAHGEVGAGHSGVYASDPRADEADLVRSERDRFDSVVGDLMARYRTRTRSAQHQHHPRPSTSTSASHALRSTNTPPTPRPRPSASRRLLNGNGDAGHEDDDYDEAALTAQEEKTELLAHLLSSLRQEVSRASEEGWMYGDVSSTTDRGRDGDGVMDEGGGAGYGAQGGGGTGVNSQGLGMGMGAAARGSTTAGGGGGGEVVAYE